MNIFLLPYTAFRHLSMGLWCAAAGLLAWWAVLTTLVVFDANWAPSMDGPLLVSTVAAAVAMASIQGESSLRRRSILQALWRVAAAGAATIALSMMLGGLWNLIVPALFFSGVRFEADAADASLVSLSFRLGAFVSAGVSCGLGTLAVRKGKEAISHLSGGLAAGLCGGVVWHVLSLPTDTVIFGIIAPQKDLYLAGAWMGISWGATFGLLAWSVPDELYAGWLRVLSGSRFGRRIPVDAPDRGAKERFVGHFPRGLDLFLPVDNGVQELHLSVTVSKDQQYTARGLSQYPTLVKRLLQRVDLRYDPRRPTPVETELVSGDRVVLGEGDQTAEVEFVLLPREEV